MTFDEAQEAFLAAPSAYLAGQYLAVAMQYEADDMLDDDTFLNALVDVREFLRETAQAATEPPRLPSGCYAVSIDGDDHCSLDLFPSEEERDEFMWQYAFENTGTDATTLDEFKASYDNDLSDAMEGTHDGYLTDDMVLQAPLPDAPAKPDKRDTFIEMIARLSASGDRVDLDGEEWPNGYEHDTGGSLDALDELIHKARDMTGIQPPEPEPDEDDEAEGDANG